MAESTAVAATNIQNARASRAAVALDNVVVAFGLARGGVYTAVERAPLDVADGEFVAIVGPTGCGKSTLLNVTAGPVPAVQRRVEIFGEALAGLNRQSGYLFQSDALFPWKTALENVAIGLETAGTPRERGPLRARKLGSRASASAPSPTAIRTCCPAASESA